MKQALFTHFSSILDNLLDNSNWFRTYFQAPWSLSDDINGEDVSEMDDNIHIRSGATRGCIIDDKYDWVVKFDIEEDYEYGSACAREVDIYTDAQERSLTKYFCPVIYLGYYQRTINFYSINDIEREVNLYEYDEDSIVDAVCNLEDGLKQEITIYIPLYAYRKAKFNFHSISRDSRERVKTLSGPLRYNERVGCLFLEYYSADDWNFLSEFLEDWDINDLHAGNIGVIGGNLRLIDYAGYHDC